ncbi:DUF3243 domain-containing protein [Lederbergia panacisoli]|uniref:DUF3243 domain-containing protein n=1 Tax=Lederbergia panacisoli TaxID=1255251 RepID=UPI00214D016A|nr:DUF3243 domain-containing protein [Lederbergia panacisoli]MCR2822144.1 DUF3243 domain-containing protein [Lederbergia panacisoli]
MDSSHSQEKVEQQLQQIDEEKKENILTRFDSFKSYLAEQVEKGEKLGLSEEALAKAAEKVGNYLAAHEEPRNREEHLLKEMWKVAEKDQQHQLAHILINMVK